MSDSDGPQVRDAARLQEQILTSYFVEVIGQECLVPLRSANGQPRQPKQSCMAATVAGAQLKRRGRRPSGEEMLLPPRCRVHHGSDDQGGSRRCDAVSGTEGNV